jgi:hypothetical protein
MLCIVIYYMLYSVVLWRVAYRYFFREVSSLYELDLQKLQKLLLGKTSGNLPPTEQLSASHTHQNTHNMGLRSKNM